MSTTRPTLASPSRLALKIMSEQDVDVVHAAALGLLGDRATAAERALAQAPEAVTLAGRVSAHDVLLDGTCSWLAAGGGASLVRPVAGGDPRAATGADLTEACRLADALPDVGLVAGPPVLTEDLTTLGELQACLEATGKHVQVSTLRSSAEAEQAVCMARTLVSAPREPAARPLISLCAKTEGLPAALVFAHAGLPVGIALPVDGGPDAASDLAIALVCHHAAVLAGCLAVQSAAPGAPFLYLAHPAHAGVTAHGPEAVLFALASIQLAARVGLPASVTALATGAPESGWQSCTDNSLGALGATTAGGAVVMGAGTLSEGRVFSAQQLVMDAEVFSWNARIAAGIPVDEGTLALEVIRQVGIGGNYLGQRHTRQNMRYVWRPRLLDRSMWDAWVASGREGPYEKATSLCRDLLREHQVAQLDGATTGALTRILATSGL